MRSPALLASLALATALGCAGNYYDSYKAKNPDAFLTTPAAGASLHETLASVYAPPVAPYALMVGKLDVLLLEGGTARVLSEAEIDAAIAGDASGDYGVVVALRCLSEVDMQRYGAEKVAWFLLDDGKLVAWDQAEFADRCLFSNEFRPASVENVELERLVIAHRDAGFPVSMEHTAEFYRKGIFYLGARRLGDAEAMLKAGDESFDSATRGRIDYKNAPQQMRGITDPEIAQVRQALVDGIARRKAEAAPSAAAP